MTRSLAASGATLTHRISNSTRHVEREKSIETDNEDADSDDDDDDDDDDDEKENDDEDGHKNTDCYDDDTIEREHTY
ncbi:hypothetical protein M8J77_009142 [Diaphorina citri]|nr:hypothetical protein M8J77_009142 [Diaphorina citri]